MDGRFQANTQHRLIRVKPPQEITNKMRVEKARASQPDSGMITTSATR